MASIAEQPAVNQLTRDEWLAKRRTGCGATDAGPIVGVCPWRTALEVYLDKIEALPPWEPKPHQKRGLQFQKTIAEIYAEETGRPIALPPQIIFHPDHEFMFASMDYLTDDRPLEIKRVNDRFRSDWGEPGSEDVPRHYYLQAQQQMACGGYEVADIAALFGWDQFGVFTIKRNEPIIDSLIKAEREFMDRVKRRDPPMPDFAHKSTLELLNLIDVEDGKTIELGKDILEWVDAYTRLNEAKKTNESAAEEVKARLIHAMGNAELAWLPDGKRLQRKTVERDGYTVAAGCYKRFSILKPKK